MQLFNATIAFRWRPAAQKGRGELQELATVAARLQPEYHPLVVALSILVAILASYVALDLARRVRSRDRISALVWGVGGALVMGTGIWSMHFVGMLAFSLPIALGFEPATTALSWFAAVAVSLLALLIASREQLTRPTLVAGALLMGGGICAMHYTGMAAMRMTPDIVWNPRIVGASVAIACVSSAVALHVFFAMRRLKGLRARLAQVGAAIILGAAISGMHYTGMAAAGFPAGSMCLSAGGLGGQGLLTVVVLSTIALLSVTLFTSVLDAHLRARAHALSRSLQEANRRLNRANDELRRMASVDPLTGVPNRAFLEQRLMMAAKAADRAAPREGGEAPHKLGVLFIDLDGFKAINDGFGHPTGDAMLRQVAQRLSGVVRQSDTLARIGGDEFVVLFEAIGSGSDALVLAKRSHAAMAAPFELPDRKLTLSCSIGIALYPDHGAWNDMLGCADAAMYTAKRLGGGMTMMFERQMRHAVSDQLDLQQALREALDRRQLRLHYQPKVDARTGALCGVEALLRWTHPERGPIGPGLFIPIAERFGMIIPIGNWVLDEAFRQLAQWQRAGHAVRMSINLSAYQLRQPDFIQLLQQKLVRHHVDPERVTFEITESVIMEDTRDTQRVLEQLLALGMRLSIDDFGTGYSSLAYLRRIRANELKVDRGFIKDIDGNQDARAVVDAVIRLAKALGLRVVAEGVETAAQRAVLVELGCEEIQGYLFSRPVSADDLERAGWLAGAVAGSATAGGATPLPRLHRVA